MRRSGNLKRLLAFITVLALVLTLAAGLDTKTGFAYENGYNITHYQIDIVVNEDNTYDITETIDCWFDPDANKHGIIRSIPTYNRVVHEDGSEYSYNAHIRDISVNENWSEESYSNEVDIRIGSGDVYVKGEKQYVIKYTFDVGKDRLRDADEFYFNLVGTSWDTTIESVDFTVQFPKEFMYNGDTLGFSHGYYYSGDFTDVKYKVENDCVTGYYHKTLDPYQGLTMRLTLEDGYFVVPDTWADKFSDAATWFPFAGLIATIAFYFLYGRRRKVIETVEFYPPEGMNPMQIGYFYDQKLDTKDITSLLVYLANKGHLEIIQKGKKKYDIHLLKATDSQNNSKVERLFYEGLATRANKKDIVTQDRLEDSFYIVIDKIRKYYDTKKLRRRTMMPMGKYKAIAYALGMLCMIMAIFSYLYQSTEDTWIAGFAAVHIAVFLIVFVPIIIGMFRTPGGRVISITFLVSLIVIIVAWGGTAAFIGLINLVHLATPMAITALVGAVCGLLIMFFGARMNRLTEYGATMYGKIMGFRRFLETAEKDRLERLVEDDPAYFYDIMPYAYVLGISDKWIKQFDGIALEPPTWYTGTDPDWTMRDFNHHLEDSMSSLTRTMNSRPVSSGGDGGGWSSSSGGGGGGFSSSSSSGGGFSGGGGGGGGGSSW